MGAFGASNGRKVRPSFCSNSRYYCTVYKDKIPRPVFNIDNPWTNIFLPVCQSQKCQWGAGRHPRAGSLSLIRHCAPPAPGWAGGEPCRAPQLPPSWQLRTTSEMCRETCPRVTTTSQPPQLHVVASPHHASRLRSPPGTNWNRDDENIEEEAWGVNPHGFARGVCTWLLAHHWSPFAEYFQHHFAHSITQSQMLTCSCPRTPLKLKYGEICTMLQNISGNCVYLPLKLGETEVSPQDLWKPRPLKSTADEFQSLFC